MSNSPTRIEVKSLTLKLFRNYISADLNFDSRHIVISGENGSGKTNLLESLSYLSPGRGLRRAAHIDVLNCEHKNATSGNSAWSVYSKINGAKGTVGIGTGLVYGVDNSPTRKTHIDKIQQKNTDSLLNHVRLVWLTPAMDGLFTGPPKDRRQFLDRLVLALDPRHSQRVRDFEKSMRGRNQLLENNSSDSLWLDSLENQMAQAAIAILFARGELLDLMQKKITASANSPFPKSIMKIEGWLEEKLKTATALQIEDEYKNELKKNRLRDKAAGRTLNGPHQSNFAVFHQTKNMPAHLCSTGEQKALLIGLLLSHIELISDITTMIPIVLLDEVAAHLDEIRRRSLFDMIDDLNCQSFSTGTDSSLFSAFGKRAQHFVANNGKIETRQTL